MAGSTAQRAPRGSTAQMTILRCGQVLAPVRSAPAIW